MLSPPASAARQPVAGREPASTPMLVIGRVTLPDYLLREQIATRVGEHRVVYSKGDRWAEPLDKGFERVLRRELASRLEPGISVETRRFAAPRTYTLFIDVLRFEGSTDGRVELWARWSLFGGGILLRAGETTVSEPAAGPGPAARVSALSTALSRLGEEVAVAVRDVAP